MAKLSTDDISNVSAGCRAGIMSVREIARQAGVTHKPIQTPAARFGTLALYLQDASLEVLTNDRMTYATATF